MRQLQILGYNVIEMWECKWTRLKQTSPDVQTYVDSLQFVDPLNPRYAFCGGCANAMKLYRRVKRSTTSITPPCTPGSTRHASTPKVILDSSRNRVTRTLTFTLVSSNVEYSPPA